MREAEDEQEKLCVGRRSSNLTGRCVPCMTLGCRSKDVQMPIDGSKHFNIHAVAILSDTRGDMEAFDAPLRD